jgi:hypothetical protein
MFRLKLSTGELKATLASSPRLWKPYFQLYVRFLDTGGGGGSVVCLTLNKPESLGGKINYIEILSHPSLNGRLS